VVQNALFSFSPTTEKLRGTKNYKTINTARYKQDDKDYDK
jgi:hypothetical protein